MLGLVAQGFALFSQYALASGRPTAWPPRSSTRYSARAAELAYTQDAGLSCGAVGLLVLVVMTLPGRVRRTALAGVLGTLLVELQRSSDSVAVWRAATEYKSIDKAHVDAETASAVRLLISKYPPPKP